MHWGFIYFYFNSNLHNIFCEEECFCQLLINFIRRINRIKFSTYINREIRERRWKINRDNK
ncbi:hypothetical protein [Plasmodium yoelii yoelii]|uniref:Uncharacterized protein n=1 Tax=Plasmodium yoelii yoelii TaxID=73239 RepID=Q7RNB2_PLAYO|nr:hypothetical protein [Plasmodium yoelii yoelii]